MKRLTALLALFAILISVFFAACGGKSNSATEDEAPNTSKPTESTENSQNTNDSQNTDDSQDTDNSVPPQSDPPNEETKPTTPMFSGNITLINLADSKAYKIKHTQIDYSADLPYTLAVLNQGEWKATIEELDYEYKITVGTDEFLYDTNSGRFYNPKTNLSVRAKQDNLSISANMINTELENARVKLQNYVSNPKSTYAGKTIEGEEFTLDATGYETGIDITSDINVLEIHSTPVNVVGIYDGKQTHFYNSRTGDHIISQDGKFFGTGCSEGFLEGDFGDVDTEKLFDDNTYCIHFADKWNEATLEKGHWHVWYVSYFYPYSADQKTAFWADGVGRNHFGYIDYIENNRYTACRYITFKENINHPIEELGDMFETVGKYGLVYNGNAVIPFEFDLIDTLQHKENSFKDNLGVYRAIKDGKVYYYSTNGTNLTPNGFVCGSQPRENRAVVYDGKKVFIINFVGETALQPEPALNVTYVLNDEEIALADGQSREITEAISNAEWQYGKTDCAFKYAFFYGKNTYYYAPECGTIAYGTEHTTLSHNQKEAINTILNSNGAPALPSAEELFGGYIYTFTYYGSYFDIETYSHDNTNSDAIRKMFINAQWQEGNKEHETFHYIFRMGFSSKDPYIHFNEFTGLLYDETYGRYAQLNPNDTAILAAIIRIPNHKFTDNRYTEEFTVAENTEEKVSIDSNCFFATDKNGVMYKLFCADTTGITEGCVVKVTYESKFKLEYAPYHVQYFYIDDYTPEYGLSVLEMDIQD